MRKRSIFIFTLLFGLLLTVCAYAEFDTVYVSSSGEAAGIGTKEQPANSLEYAYTLLGDSGTICLLDTISVSGNENGCFVAPPHSGKITITSAPDTDGKLDLTAVKHFHFGGNTEWKSFEAIANDIVLSADNHTVTMGEGIRFLNQSGTSTYRGGHVYCGARVHLTLYTPCSSVRTCTEAGGRLYVFSGEYWSVSAWFGNSVSVIGGEAQIYLGTQNTADSIWVRYLCPGACAENYAVLDANGAATTIIVDTGVQTTDPYRVTQGTLSGTFTVNWLLKDSAQGSATSFVPRNCTAASGSTCTLNLYIAQENSRAVYNGARLLNGMPQYAGSHDGSLDIPDFETGHFFLPSAVGSVCAFCGHVACGHFSTELILTADASGKDCATYSVRCTDCGEIVGTRKTHALYIASDGRILCHLCNYEQCRHLVTKLEKFSDGVNGECAIFNIRCDDLCLEIIGTRQEHELYTAEDGRILCIHCPYEQCRHLTTEKEWLQKGEGEECDIYNVYCTDLCQAFLGTEQKHDLYYTEDGMEHCYNCSRVQCLHSQVERVVIKAATCTSQGQSQLKCLFGCGEYIPNTEQILPISSALHSNSVAKYTTDGAHIGFRCTGCNTRYALYDVDALNPVIYVGEGGTDYLPECPPPKTQTDPLFFATFTNLIRYLNVAGKYMENVTIYVCGAVSVPNGLTFPQIAGTATISGATEDATLFFGEYTKRIRLSGDMVIEGVRFCAADNKTDIVICAQNHNLTMGEGLSTPTTNETINVEGKEIYCIPAKVLVIGGFPGSNAYGETINSNITVRSGQYRFVGGWNYNASTNDGTSIITIGKTNPDDILYVEYLCPFSRGDGFITEPAVSTIVIDGDLSVNRFYVTTLNKATIGVDYITNIILKGDITNAFDICGTADNKDESGAKVYPNTIVNVYADYRLPSVEKDVGAFYGAKADSTLSTIQAIVSVYPYTEYCAQFADGHFDFDTDGACDECGMILTMEEDENGGA